MTNSDNLENPKSSSIVTVAANAINGLRLHPNLLILVVLNALMFGLLYFGVSSTNARRDEHLLRVIDACLNKK